MTALSSGGFRHARDVRGFAGQRCVVARARARTEAPANARDARAPADAEPRDKRRVRDSLFSPSASSSSSVEADEPPAGDERGKAPLFPTRAASMMGSNPRSRSANANSKKQLGAADARRRTMFPASASFTMGSATAATVDPSENLGGSAVLPERRGLFEADDDSESIEAFQERAKLRHSKKKSEMDALREQLEAAQQRTDQLEAQVVRESKEKEESEIRMKECQRIIEKRNKQLIKASERMARFTEQSESQVAELQARVAALTAENSQLRIDSAESLDKAHSEAEQRYAKLQSDFDSKWKQHERHVQGRAERAVEIAEQSVQAKLAENTALRRKIQELEFEIEAATTEVNTAKVRAEAATAAAAENLMPSRIKTTEEYQNLMKQFENAEAISRGLRYQLDKEREEKKYLKQQLGTIQTSGVNVAGFFDPNAAASVNNPSPTSSAASGADLSSFDFTAPLASNVTRNESTPPSPVNTKERSRSQSRSRSSSSGFFSSTPFGIGKPSDDTGDSKEDAAPDQEPTRKKRGSSVNALQTPLETFTQEIDDGKTTSPAPGGLKTASSSVNFFEKFSIKFKRSSSPRSSATAGNSQDVTSASPQPTVSTSATAPSTATIGSSVVSPLPRSAVSGRGKVLMERPRMYVARSPSHHEDESSDSIFGSESESSSSFDTEDEIPPPPPPPPAQEMPLPRSSDRPPIAASPTSLFTPVDGGAEADSSDLDDSDESSSSDEAAIEAPRPAPSGLPEPIPVSSVAGIAMRSPPAPATKVIASPLLSYSDSLSSDLSSPDDDDAASIEKRSPFSSPAQPVHRQPTRSKSDRSESPSSSSASDDEAGRLSAKHRSRGRPEEADSKTRKRDKRSMSLPRSPNASSHHNSHADGRHKSVVKNRMNEYMEARTKKRNDKLKKKEEKENAEHKKKEEYEREWEKMAQEERERKRKQQQARRTGRRRPASMKTVRVSQMRQQMTKQQMQKDASVHYEQRPRGDTTEEVRSRRHSQHRNENKTSGSEDEGNDDNDEEAKPSHTSSQPTESPPLPPEPTEADTELYLRQQARLRERHEMEMKRKQDAEEADQVRGQIHHKIEMWSFGKELLHMILTLDQVSTSDALKNCQLMVVQSPDNETVRKAYRYRVGGGVYKGFGC